MASLSVCVSIVSRIVFQCFADCLAAAATAASTTTRPDAGADHSRAGGSLPLASQAQAAARPPPGSPGKATMLPHQSDGGSSMHPAGMFKSRMHIKRVVTQQVVRPTHPPTRHHRPSRSGTPSTYSTNSWLTTRPCLLLGLLVVVVVGQATGDGGPDGLRA